MIPSRPVRKSASVNARPNGPAPGANPAMPVSRSAKPFGSVPKSAYNRQTAPVSPLTVPVKDNSDHRNLGNNKSSSRGTD